MRRIAAALLALSACKGSGSPDNPFVVSKDGVLQDSAGRTVILRGVNARVSGVFDVSFDDGRTAVEPIPTLGDDDLLYLADNGVTLLRLPLSWSGLEPRAGAVSEAYLQAVDQVVAGCARHGILVLLDMHQDAYSKEIGEDGAPLWAIVPPPTQLLEGPLTDLDQRRTSAQVMAAFASFYENQQGLQDAYAQAFAAVARRYQREPAVLGYEIQNEPVAFDDVKLSRFHQRVAAALRAADPTHVVYFEPDALRNAVDSAPRATVAFSDGNAGYAPHVYTDVFSGSHDGWSSRDPERLRPSVENARAEALSWNTSLLVGEFGIDPHLAQAPAYLSAELDLFEKNGASSAFWLYREESQGGWGLFDHDPSGRWTERTLVADALFRPYVHRLPGALVSSAWDPGGKTFTVVYEARPRGDVKTLPMVLAVPRRHFAFGARFQCDGADATGTLAGSLATVPCGEQGGRHTVVVSAR